MLIRYNFDHPELINCRVLQIGVFKILVDRSDYFRVKNYIWEIKPYHHNAYAVRKIPRGNSYYFLPIHRQITHCPKNRIVHHINRNGLDNRRCNLKIMTHEEHFQIHRFCS